MVVSLPQLAALVLSGIILLAMRRPQKGGKG